MAPQIPNMPVPSMARPMAPQPMTQTGGVPGMADGGLATLPVDSDMFNYAPGGIVAFADEGLVPRCGGQQKGGGRREKRYG